MQKLDTRVLLLVMLTPSLVSCQKWFNITTAFKSIPVNNGSIVDVSVQLEFNQLVANSLIMNVEMTYFLILRWQDNRFIRRGSSDPNKKYVTLYGTDADWENIWIPDIYLINEIPTGLLDFNPTDSVRVYENGTLRMSKRHITTFYCRIRVFKVPMTHETCSVEFQSNSYTANEMNITWWHFNPIIYSPNFVSIVSEIVDVETIKCSGKSPSEDEDLVRPCLYANIAVDQVYKGFVIQVYLPSSAIIFMLWLSFWISLREVSSRVRVVSVALVAIVTQTVGIMIVFPDTVEMEPLLVWTGACIGMNLIAFIEFIFVHNMYIAREIRRGKKNHEKINLPTSASYISRPTLTYNLENGHTNKDLNHSNTNNNNGTIGKSQIQSKDPEEESVHMRTLRVKSPSRLNLSSPYIVDRLCMVLYLVLFGVFNIFYWIYYLS